MVDGIKINELAWQEICELLLKSSKNGYDVSHRKAVVMFSRSVFVVFIDNTQIVDTFADRVKATASKNDIICLSNDTKYSRYTMKMCYRQYLYSIYR